MNRQVKDGVYTINNIEENFNYFTNLRSSDKISFVNFVVNTIVDTENKMYNHAIKNIMFDFAVVQIFSDVDTYNLKAINDIEDFLIETNIANIIKTNVEVGLIDELHKSVDIAISYKTGISYSPISDAVVELIKTVEEKVSDIDTKGMMEMAQVLSGISGELTTDKLVDSYAKSELFKKTHKIEENEDKAVEIKQRKKSSKK